MDYHNELLDVLAKVAKLENNNGCIRIRSLVEELTSKEISVLQIIDDNTGIIIFNDQDYSYIEKLCEASLTSQDEYFPRANMSLIFDFLYVQSYIIRKYFLRRRINYKHIFQKYQCYIRQISDEASKTSDIEMYNLDHKYAMLLNNQQLETDWNHLKEMPLDKLYQGHSFLRQIILLIKKQENDRSQEDLYDFIDIIDNNRSLFQKLEEYDIKNFKLCYIDCIRELYEQAMTGFEHLFTTVSPLLRIPINTQVNTEFIEILKTKIINIDYNNDIDRISEIIQHISNLLKDLSQSETILLRQSNELLKIACEKSLNFKNPILALIPNDIKCENYVSLYIQLNKTTSILEEQMIIIKENQVMSLWNEVFPIDYQNTTNPQENLFKKYRDTKNNDSKHDQQDRKNEESLWEYFNMNTECKGDTVVVNDILLTTDNFSYTQQDHTVNVESEKTDEIHFSNEIKYSVLFQLAIDIVSLQKSTFIQQIHEKRQEQKEIQSIILTKFSKFFITYPENKIAAHLWKPEKFYEQLKKVFSEKNYDLESYAVIDNDQIFVNFMNNNTDQLRRIQFEFKIVQQTSLIKIQFYYKEKIFEYFVTSEANVMNVINRFIHDNDLHLISPDIYLIFFDEFGKCINEKTIDSVVNDKSIKITVTTEDNPTDSILYEVKFYPNEGKYLFFHRNFYSFLTIKDNKKLIYSIQQQPCNKSIIGLKLKKN